MTYVEFQKGRGLPFQEIQKLARLHFFYKNQ